MVFLGVLVVDRDWDGHFGVAVLLNLEVVATTQNFSGEACS